MSDITRKEVINILDNPGTRLTNTEYTEDELCTAHMFIVDSLKSDEADIHVCSRESIFLDDAIKAMDDLEREDYETYGCSIPEGFDGERAKEALKKLPSIQPKVGHWIIDEERKADYKDVFGNRHTTYHYSVHCEDCDFHWDYSTDKEGSTPSNYCPKCGAKMELYKGESE